MVERSAPNEVDEEQLLDKIRDARSETTPNELRGLSVRQQNLARYIWRYTEKEKTWAKAQFVDCRFEGLKFLKFNLRNTQYEDCGFSDDSFPRADLRSAVFTNCEFSNVEFTEADLVEATFESCQFTDTRFARADLGDAVFRYCEPMAVDLDRSDLSNAKFMDCDLSDVDFRNARLHRTRLSSLSSLDREEKSWWESRRRRIRQERDGEWEQAAEVYLLLKENFATLANHADASWAHFKERQMRRMSGGSLREWVNEFTWGYGEKPERPFRVGVLVIVLSTLLAWLLNTWWGGLAEASSLGDYLLFSAASFVLTSFPGLEAEHIGVQLLSLIVGGLGVVTLSMFTFAVGQRISGN